MKTEDDVRNRTQLAVQANGGVAWRNNSGVAREIDEHTGGLRPVRYGLGNMSARLNEVFKSSDLIGIAPGGIFCAWECKKPGWRWRGTAHERAQLAFITRVRERGGRAGFVTGEAEAIAIMFGHSIGAPHG